MECEIFIEQKKEYGPNGGGIQMSQNMPMLFCRLSQLVIVHN